MRGSNPDFASMIDVDVEDACMCLFAREIEQAVGRDRLGRLDGWVGGLDPAS